MELRAAEPTSPVDDARVPARRVIRVLVVGVLLLNVANAASIAAGAGTARTKYLLLALERNPSTWFSAAILGLAGAAAWAIGRGRADVGIWNVVAAIFAVLSLDEVATFHEWLGAVPGIPGIGSRGWVGAGLLLAAIVAARLLRWALSLEATLQLALFLGGAVFLTGAVGFEVISGNRQASHGTDAVYWTLATVEENLEMLGVLVVLRGLLRHLAERTAGVTLRVV